MNHPNVSVCLAAYNGGTYLSEQIESILVQLLPGDELVIVNDKSSDLTSEIIATFARKHTNIRIFENAENMGVKKTFENALLHAVNDVVVFSDQDDIWISKKLPKIRIAFLDPQISGFLGNAIVFGASVNDEKTFFTMDYAPQFTIFDQFLRNDFIGCCLAFRKSKIVHALPFPESISMHDWWIGVNCIMAGHVMYDPEPLIKYRRHDANVSPSSRRGWRRVVSSRFFDAGALLLLLYRIYFGGSRSSVPRLEN